jgi:hypothetical protein
MNTKMLLAAAFIATLTGSALAGQALLSPRAYDAQIKVAAPADTTVTTIEYVGAVTSVSPRVEAARIKVVKGVSQEQNAALDCLLTMKGSPKAVTACSQSTTMPGCQK